jgi:signal transduction histidine kinase
MSGLVLFVDDDAANLVVCEAIVGGELELLTAQSAAKALEILRSREVAVLVTDQRMPGLTGVELCEQALSLSPNTIRILITAYSDLKAAIDAINRGQVRRYLRKPWEPEELLAELRDALAVYETAHQLRAAERRLREVERVYTLGVIAAAVAHELRSPLTVVTVSAELVRLELTELRKDLERSDTSLADVRRRLDVQLTVIDDIELGANQMRNVLAGVAQNSRGRAIPDVFELAEVARQAIRLLPFELRDIGRTVLEVVGTPRVAGSVPKLMQLVLNLIVNALQALATRRPENLIRIVVWSTAESAILEVRDNGPGIPVQDLAKVFEHFFTTKSVGGAGLGLAISETIAREHGGTLTAESKPGEGACFRLVLPLVS